MEKKNKYVVQKDICAGCGACIHVCSHGAIGFDADDKVKIDQKKCKRCGQCIFICPFEAIKEIKHS